MEALRLELFGRGAHFKNPESNIYLEVSYDNIHKPVVLGILGAIIGLRGRQHAKELGYIEYWEELKNLKVSIVPASARWRKHIDEMNNSTGFANNKENQIVRRQMLENVRWTVYILKDTVEGVYWDALVKNLSARRSEYPIYLGKTGLVARLGKVDVVDLFEVDCCNIESCDSVVMNKCVDYIDKEVSESHHLADDELFIRGDYLPVGLGKYNMYILEKYIFTNSYISVREGDFYKYEDSFLYFF